MCLRRESDTPCAGQGTCISTLSQHAQRRMDSGTQWAFSKSRCAGCVTYRAGAAWQRGVCAFLVEGKYCREILRDADGTP